MSGPRLAEGMLLDDEGLLENGEDFVCSVCGHEPCFVCIDFCDDCECLAWSGDRGEPTHVCDFQPRKR